MSIRAVVAIAALIAAVTAALLAVGELTRRRARRGRLGRDGSTGRSEVIVVLGYKNKGDRANALNRYRVRAALRSVDPTARESVLVFCGGPVRGRIPEADLMDDYARRTLGYSGRSMLDRTSTSTWQNIQNAVPFLESADTIKIVSNSFHARKARTYLWKQRPDLAARLSGGSPPSRPRHSGSRR